MKICKIQIPAAELIETYTVSLHSDFIMRNIVFFHFAVFAICRTLHVSDHANYIHNTSTCKYRYALECLHKKQSDITEFYLEVVW